MYQMPTCFVTVWSGGTRKLVNAGKLQMLNDSLCTYKCMHIYLHVGINSVNLVNTCKQLSAACFVQIVCDCLEWNMDACKRWDGKLQMLNDIIPQSV